ncbi:MAG: L-threonine 3-dehydrogenase [Candidatus Hermodarchaeota archaeon]|nr:L-threonine 3-dehydrogenase [Candidatus Hermodarchaeota archaeon]
MEVFLKKKPGPGIERGAVNKPTISDIDVLVEVKGAAICGTDVHVYEWDEWAAGRIKPPLVVGHEMSGKIVEVGKKVTHLRVGDMVSAETHIVDQTCLQCLTGREHVCQNMTILGVDRDGVFAEYVSIPAHNAWKNDPDLDSIVGAIQEPLGNAVQTLLPIGNVEDIAGRNVLVTGMGPIGLFAVAVAKELGADKVFATAGGRNKTREQLAKSMGADEVYSARDLGREAIVNAIYEATEGNGVDVAAEMSGHPDGLVTAFDALTKGGRVSLLGVFPTPFEVDLNRLMIFKAATIYGISGRLMYRTWYQVRGLLRRSTLRQKVEKVITHRVPMRDLEEGYQLILSKQAAKVGLTPDW